MVMLAVIETIDTEVEARLGLIGVAELTVEASGDPSNFPALDIKASRWEPVNGQEPDTTYYNYFVSVEGNVEGGSGVDARRARNALYRAVVNAVVSDNDYSGLIEWVEERGTRPGVAILADKRRLSFVTEFCFHFPAAINDPAI
jgi:hypothetical protein